MSESYRREPALLASGMSLSRSCPKPPSATALNSTATVLRAKAATRPSTWLLYASGASLWLKRMRRIGHRRGPCGTETGS